MSSSQSLPAAVEALEDKAQEHKQAQNTQYHVSVTRHNISQVNGDLDELIARLRKLKYYKTVLEESFNGSDPTMIGSAVQAAEDAAGVTQEELLKNVQNGEMGETDPVLNDPDADGGGELEVQLTPAVETQLKQIRSAKKQVKNVTETIKRNLESERDEWNGKVNAAEEVQKILGGQNSDFAGTLNHMSTLLNRKLMDSSGSASNFVAQWENAVSNWREQQSLQSLDDFQERHDLSDDTIEVVKTLSRSQQLTLADVSVDTLEEIKQVDELESAVKLSL